MINWLIKKIFEYLYDDYIYTFTKADIEIAKMDKEERYQYLEAAKRFRRSHCYKVEMESIIANLYKDLSTKTMNKRDVAAYRMALIFLRQFESRISHLASRHDTELAVDSQLRKQ